MNHDRIASLLRDLANEFDEPGTAPDTAGSREVAPESTSSPSRDTRTPPDAEGSENAADATEEPPIGSVLNHHVGDLWRHDFGGWNMWLPLHEGDTGQQWRDLRRFAPFRHLHTPLTAEQLDALPVGTRVWAEERRPEVGGMSCWWQKRSDGHGGILWTDGYVATRGMRADATVTLAKPEPEPERSVDAARAACPDGWLVMKHPSESCIESLQAGIFLVESEWPQGSVSADLEAIGKAIADAVDAQEALRGEGQ